MIWKVHNIRIEYNFWNVLDVNTSIYCMIWYFIYKFDVKSIQFWSFSTLLNKNGKWRVQNCITFTIFVNFSMDIWLVSQICTRRWVSKYIDKSQLVNSTTATSTNVNDLANRKIYKKHNKYIFSGFLQYCCPPITGYSLEIWFKKSVLSALVSSCGLEKRCHFECNPFHFWCNWSYTILSLFYFIQSTLQQFPNRVCIINFSTREIYRVQTIQIEYGALVLPFCSIPFNVYIHKWQNRCVCVCACTWSDWAFYSLLLFRIYVHIVCVCTQFFISTRSISIIQCVILTIII